MAEHPLVDIERIDLAANSRGAMVAGLIAAEEAKNVLELGVWEGAFAAEMLGACPGIESYWMLDPWRQLADWDKPFNIDDGPFEAAYQAAMSATEFAAGKRRVLRGTTQEKIAEIPDASLDLAYVDGDHTLRGVAVDLIAVWPKLKEGGLLVGDDFTPSIWQHGPFYEPTAVFPFAVHFAEGHDCPIIALSRNQFAIRKGVGGFRFIDPSGRYPGTGLRAQVGALAQGQSLAKRVAHRVLRR